ncbi:MAG: hypothetical protein OYL41_09835 [Acidobacteriota bacterium]|nr:hypothetical protein [Acidobacteriota bacterium]
MEGFPVLLLRQLEWREAAIIQAALDGPRPVVRFAHDVELRSRHGISDSPKLHLKPEKTEPLIGDLVQPVQSRTVFISEPGRDPNDGHRLKPRRVCEQLAQVNVIRSFNLVLDEHPAIRAEILAKDVSAERPDGLFLGIDFEFQPEGLFQNLEVLRLRKPRREVCGFTGPDLPELDAFQASE